jgi:isoleucyl-tRNA synthetase
LLGALDGFTLQEKISDTDYARMPELERLMLHQLAEMDVKVRDYITHYEYGKLAQTLHLFCANELSAFYFDIRKDRLYCDRPDSFERRATRTVMAHIFECLVTWLAPILSFTTEEAWSHRPKGVFEDAESVHLKIFPKLPKEWNQDEKFIFKWKRIFSYRDDTNEVLEPLRKNKEIGSSLDASIVLTLWSEEKDLFQGISWEEILIVSKVSISDETIQKETASWAGEQIVASRAIGEKCVRCWKVLPEVAIHRDHLCHRCADAITVKKAD